MVKEMGDYYIDGVAFPAEEIVLEFAEPVDQVKSYSQQET